MPTDGQGKLLFCSAAGMSFNKVDLALATCCCLCCRCYCCRMLIFMVAVLVFLHSVQGRSKLINAHAHKKHISCSISCTHDCVHVPHKKCIEKCVKFCQAMLKDYLSAHMAATVVESERERRGEGKRCLITHFVHCKFLYHIFLSSSFFLLSLSLFCGFGSVPTNTYTRRHTHTHRCCMELLCKTIKNGNLNAAPKSRLRKNTATVLIAVSLAPFFFLCYVCNSI